MSRRDLIKMTAEKIAAFLREERKVQVATNGRDGFTTYRTSQKVLNLRRDPAMTCLVEGGTSYGELRGVTLHGRALVTEDPAVLIPLGTSVGRFLAGLPDDAPVTPEFAAGIEMAMAKRVAVVLEPERVLSWDHRKQG